MKRRGQLARARHHRYRLGLRRRGHRRQRRGDPWATYDNGIELIKELVNHLDWEDMDHLVTGMLKAMGYCARVMPQGPDGSRDVVASPDALGLESPRIVAEVKHHKGAMGAPAVRSFIGGLRAGDRGLCVSTGDFTKEARYEVDRTNAPYAYSIWMPSYATTSMPMTRQTTTLVPFSRSPAFGDQRKKAFPIQQVAFEIPREIALRRAGKYTQCGIVV